jgi:Fic family protein
MRVVSGNSLDPTVHFEAPPADRIPSEMDTFIEWFNQKNPPVNSVLKSALAHLYFVTLHPFEDGNGRLARAVADMALCRGDNFGRVEVPDSLAGMPHFENRLRTDHLFSMSAQLCKERKDYYRHLEEAQNQDSMDVTDWLLWYVGCMNRAVLSVLSELKKSLFRKSFWEYADGFDLNVRQKKILALLLDDFKGKLTSSKYAKICKCSQDTAGRDMEKLVQANILRKGDAGGRSTEYMLVK